MYAIAGIPLWLGAAAWAAAAGLLALAIIRLRRRPINFMAALGLAAFLAGLRLLEFPLHTKLELGGGLSAVGFAAILFGPEVAVCALAAAVAAQGLLTPKGDWAAMGVNLLAVAAAPWAAAWLYRSLRRAFPSGAAGYVWVFLAGAAGIIAVAAVSALALVAAQGAAAAESLTQLALAALALAAAEGVLATWGYGLKLARGGDAAADAVLRPGTRAGLIMLIAGVVIAAALAPFVPGVASFFGRHFAPVRLTKAGPLDRAVVAFGIAAAAAAAAALPFGLAALLRPRTPK